MWDLHYLRQLEPEDFENLVAHLFNLMGYKTCLTPASKDGGVDIEVSIEHVGLSHRWLVQVKRYSNNVGVKEVREYCSLKYRELADGVIIVTTSRFTKQAHEEAAKHNVKLIEGPLLITMLDHYCPEESSVSKSSLPKADFAVNGEPVIGRQLVMFEGSKIMITLTAEHLYFEKLTGSLLSRKSELLRRVKVKDIVGVHQESNETFLVIGGNNIEIINFVALKNEAFHSTLESLRPLYLRGEHLLKMEKSGREFVILTSRRFVILGKNNEHSLSINLKNVAGCEKEKSGALRREKMVLLEAENGIIRHKVEVKDVSEWMDLVKGALQGC
ncbi:restriction endonuclease [Methanohalophilus sp.]|uniref:restriction endonuclease n=1 Tax=Methanohalophilus sp. TaxID=1966352 RepID=UPI00263886FF|nr:restriction endonuclease [Methanohalophilus sp.]MDK2893028.1 restriction system protein [Methanohalophilus sp.]